MFSLPGQDSQILGLADYTRIMSELIAAQLPAIPARDQA